MPNRAIPDVAIDVPALGVFEVLIPGGVGSGEPSELGQVEPSLHVALLDASWRQYQAD